MYPEDEISLRIRGDGDLRLQIYMGGRPGFWIAISFRLIALPDWVLQGLGGTFVYGVQFIAFSHQIFRSMDHRGVEQIPCICT